MPSSISASASKGKGQRWGPASYLQVSSLGPDLLSDFISFKANAKGTEGTKEGAGESLHWVSGPQKHGKGPRKFMQVKANKHTWGQEI